MFDAGQVAATGAGKTTLLKTLTGMMLPASGSVEVLGKPVSRQIAPVELRQLRSRIGQVFQGLHLVGRLSAIENVLIGALGRSQSILTVPGFFRSTNATMHRLRSKPSESVILPSFGSTACQAVSGRKWRSPDVSCSTSR